MDDEPFIETIEDRDQPMARLTDPIAPVGSGSALTGVPVSDERSNANAVREGLAAKQVCPFCGSQNPVSGNANTNSNGPCPRCTMEDTAATRQATKARIGPWHVLQTRNPAAPGMRYATLLALVGKGQVTSRSVVRGPTTHQLWRYAAHVKGLSREFGVCYSCGESIDKSNGHCPHCDRAQEPVGNPDALLEAREPMPVAVAPASTFAAEETAASDSYPIVTRQTAALPVLSHAERLRTGNEIRPELRRKPDGRALSAMELAAALQVAPPPPPPQGHPVRTVMITVLVVAILASVIVGFARPDLRRQAQDWVQTASSQVGEKLSSFHLQKEPPSAERTAPRPQNDITSDNPPVAQNSQPVDPPLGFSNASPAAQDNGFPAHDISTPAPLTPPDQITVGQGASAQPMTPQVAPVPDATPPAAVAPSPVPDQSPMAVPTPTPRASLLPDRPILVGGVPTVSEIWALHSRGLDAEGRQDWAQAVQCYQQIEQAPKDQWPSDVKIRLENAQRQLSK